MAQPMRERGQTNREMGREAREKTQFNTNIPGRGLPLAQTSTIIVDESIHDGKTLVMLTPQFLMIDQLRIEIDRRIAPRHWVTFSPHYIQNNVDYQTHWGLGLGATYKWFIADDSPVYVGGGLQFTHHVLNNSALDDVSETDIWLYRTNITQYGVNVITGRYIRFTNNLYGDIYGGFGYRMSSTKSTDDWTTQEFRNRFFNLAQTGLTVVIGVRVGIML
jgi:hypothetical protein